MPFPRLVKEGLSVARPEAPPVTHLLSRCPCLLSRTGSDSLSFPSLWQVKTEEQIAAEEAWYETEKVWLVHKDGFSLATQLKSKELSLPEGKLRVKLDHDGAVLDVDEDDVEKVRRRLVEGTRGGPCWAGQAVCWCGRPDLLLRRCPPVCPIPQANAPSCDRLEDLASLVYLNESSVLHTLRQRHGASLLHTYAGPSLLVLSPRGAPAVYSEKVMHMFKGCRREDMGPHIYAVAQTAYRAMLMSRQDQSIILLGSSGSGKTTSCQHLVQYLATIAGTSGNKVSPDVMDKWQALSTLLEAFGNSPTVMNGNATRFSQILSLDFDQAGQVASASIQTMLLEKLRVARRPAGEATFNVFYYLLACGDGTLRTELHLNHLAENNVFGIVPLAKPEEKQKAAQQFSKLQTAMKVLGVSPDEQKVCWLILAAIYHLGAAGATKEAPEEQAAGRRQFARHEWAQKAAYLLGCSLEELSSAIFKHHHQGGTLQRSTSFRQGPEESSLGEGTGPKLSALECLEGMASGLYSELFTLLISLANRALKSSQHSLCSVMIVDTPGFQNPEQGGSARGASFEELCHNYAQDRLQRLFHERTFVQELERYKEENIELAFDDLEPATDDSVAAVDQASHQSLDGSRERQELEGVRSLARTDEARGLLWLLEEEALVPGATEDTLLQRLFSYYGPQEGDKKGPILPLRQDALIDTVKKSKLHFVHCFLPVAEGWAGEPRSAASRRVSSSSELDLPPGEHCEAGGLLPLDVPLLRAQLRGSRLLDAMRMYRQGYPDHMVFSEFRRRFDVLAPHLTKKHGRNYIVVDERRNRSVNQCAGETRSDILSEP
ncbi:hypothetical protein Celaphus_00000782 [Cervus elaphus hippelaphus]|uniref:Myosin motor domain-containing protein n=1 Tax=Cervus elaphus hippelaphus TaxID=46360 RepID=A0A212D8V2_CEREH|nr:hypothetical protein Celaphus_00000782 [Cervus elaphus hippelaphus]